MPKRYDSSLHSDNTISQAHNSLGKLHEAVSQALSHPSEQVIDQAYSRLEHTETAIQQAAENSSEQAVDLVASMLDDEKDRLSALFIPEDEQF